MGIMEKDYNEFKLQFLDFAKDEKDFVIFPNTYKSKRYLEKVLLEINIVAILDNNKKLDGDRYKNIPIYYADRYLRDNGKSRILISGYYSEISRQLDELGYKENIDYMDMQKFISMWYWENKKEIHLFELHTAITTFCTLNCKNCNMFINHYPNENKKHVSLIEYKKNTEYLFANLDYCYKFVILGGEPLLNRDWVEMIKWTKEKFGDKIGEIEITTNGTIVPEKEVIKECRKYGIVFAISNYGVEVEKKQKIEELEKLFKENQINYIVKNDMKWKDFFFPTERQGAKFESYRGHMFNCNPVFRGLNDSKFYYCHIVWSAEQCGIYKCSESDYLNIGQTLSEKEKEELMAFDIGFIKTGYVSLCKYCGGCGSDNEKIIPAGIQN